MLPDNSGASATVARTLRAGRLHHIGLPQTLDVGTDYGQSYVVGQWVDGATLTDLLAGGPLDPDVATSITAKLSEAVAEAHRNGIAFGALNPSLVRVNFDGQVRLSHVIAHGSATPDQDIRAIGALLYLMLTGTWPLGDPVKPGATALPGGELAADRSGPAGRTDQARPGIAGRRGQPDGAGGVVRAGRTRAAPGRARRHPRGRRDRRPAAQPGNRRRHLAAAAGHPGQTAQPGRPPADQGTPGQAQPGRRGARRVRRADRDRAGRADQPVRRLDPEQRPGRAADDRLRGQLRRRSGADAAPADPGTTAGSTSAAPAAPAAGPVRSSPAPSSTRRATAPPTTRTTSTGHSTATPTPPG